MSKTSEDARILDNAIRDANIRATEAFDAGDDGAFTDASTDLASLRDMRLALGETDWRAGLRHGVRR